MISNAIKPHRKKSRVVNLRNEEDRKRIIQDTKPMLELCKTKSGIYNGALAIAHCQITDNDPLRFFVTESGSVYINPQILQHTRTTIDSEEGCYSYPDRKPIVVKRFNKINVVYEGISFDGIMQENISGKLAKVFQHEIDHFNAIYIYDKLIKMKIEEAFNNG